MNTTLVVLSERERAALNALATFGQPGTGENLAALMRANGREQTSLAAAHQAAAALDRKGLAAKRYGKREPIRYEITERGGELIAAAERGPVYKCCEHCEHFADEPRDPQTGEYVHDVECPYGCNDNDDEIAS